MASIVLSMLHLVGSSLETAFVRARIASISVMDFASFWQQPCVSALHFNTWYFAGLCCRSRVSDWTCSYHATAPLVVAP
jgi:hypothetical protein